MKTDFHCHILPGIDDGAQTIEEAVFLVKKLNEWGFANAVCVAHSNAKYRNTPYTVNNAYQALCCALQEEHIDLSLQATCEYRLVPETWPEVRANNWLLPWDGNNLLIEFPIRSRESFGNLSPVEEIKWLISEGYQPVLAHPERYHYMAMDEYRQLLDLGCEFQMNLGSLYGFYDEETKARAEFMKKEGWYSYTGTDLHNKRYTDFYDTILKT